MGEPKNGKAFSSLRPMGALGQKKHGFLHMAVTFSHFGPSTLSALAILVGDGCQVILLCAV